MVKQGPYVTAKVDAVRVRADTPSDRTNKTIFSVEIKYSKLHNLYFYYVCLNIYLS